MIGFVRNLKYCNKAFSNIITDYFPRTLLTVVRKYCNRRLYMNISHLKEVAL